MASGEPSKTVVLADDQASQRVVFEMMLMRDEYQVVALADGQEVLNYLKTHTPDIMVLDVNMPHIDGFSICERVKRIPRLQHVPVVIVTQLDEHATRASGKWVKADAVLYKPVDGDKLLGTLRSLLKKNDK